MSFLNYRNYIPDLYINKITDLDFKQLYAEGYRLILTDLDNTLISYKETEPTPEIISFVRNLEAIGFEVFIISNSLKDRVSHFSSILGVDYVKFAKKPLKGGFKKAFKKLGNKYKKEEILYFGDQLMTDILGGKRMELKTHLVKAIDRKTEKAVTRFNRLLEKIVLKRIYKKDRKSYDEKLKEYVLDVTRRN